MDQCTSTAGRNTQVGNAVTAGAVGVILAQPRHQHRRRRPRSRSRRRSRTSRSSAAAARISTGSRAFWRPDRSRSGSSPTATSTTRAPWSRRSATRSATRPARPHRSSRSARTSTACSAPRARTTTRPATAPRSRWLVSSASTARQGDPHRRLRRRGGRAGRRPLLRGSTSSRRPRRRATSATGRWTWSARRSRRPSSGRWCRTGPRTSWSTRAMPRRRRAGFAGMQNCFLGQSDHQAYWDAGIPAALFIWLNYRKPLLPRTCLTPPFNPDYTTEPEYHRPTDGMNNVSQERLQNRAQRRRRRRHPRGAQQGHVHGHQRQRPAGLRRQGRR